MFLLYSLYFQNFKKFKDQLLSLHTNVNIKLCIKNKFIDQIVKYLIWMKFNIHTKNIKNMKCNS